MQVADAVSIRADRPGVRLVLIDTARVLDDLAPYDQRLSQPATQHESAYQVYILADELLNPTVNSALKARLLARYQRCLPEAAKKGQRLVNRLTEMGFASHLACEKSLWHCVDTLWKTRKPLHIALESAP